MRERQTPSSIGGGAVGKKRTCERNASDDDDEKKKKNANRRDGRSNGQTGDLTVCGRKIRQQVPLL